MKTRKPDEPKIDHLPAELCILEFRLQNIRHAHFKTTELIFEMEKHIHRLRQPFIPAKA